MLHTGIFVLFCEHCKGYGSQGKSEPDYHASSTMLLFKLPNSYLSYSFLEKFRYKSYAQPRTMQGRWSWVAVIEIIFTLEIYNRPYNYSFVHTSAKNLWLTVGFQHQLKLMFLHPLNNYYINKCKWSQLYPWRMHVSGHHDRIDDRFEKKLHAKTPLC